MRAILQQAAAGWFWLNVAALPVFAQVDRIGGPVEFRSADRPIPTPTLQFPESASSDSSKLHSIGLPPADEVLKQIDKELGRTGVKSSAEGDLGRPGSSARITEPRRGLEGSTFK
jgi:hypothetical protein